MPRFFLIAIAALAALAHTAGAAVLRETSGLVQIRAEGEEGWSPVGRLPRTAGAGASVRTGFSARAAVVLDGGGTLELAGNSQVVLEGGTGGGVVVDLLFGTARLSARALGGRALELRTPTGTARARSESVDWRASVGGGGSAVFEVASGLVVVEDVKGGFLRLRDGERVEADLAGLHEPESVPAPPRARRDEFAERMRRELALDRESDSVQSLVSGEVRRTEFEMGRALTDASGLRVRAEDFVVRTGPSSFSFVALNGRRGPGLSFYSWSGRFDRVLPTDLSGVFGILPGSAGAAAPWTLTSYVTVRSNGSDALVERAIGGHQVDLNHNVDPTDDVAVLYNPATDGFVSVTGQPVFKVLFDGYGLYSNGVLKRGLTGTAIQSPHDALQASANDPITGAALAVPLPVYGSNTTFPDAASARQVVYESYGDGTYLSMENRSVASGGGVSSALQLGGATAGPGYQKGILKSSFQQTTTASEISRAVNVLVSPRILIETGGIP